MTLEERIKSAEQKAEQCKRDGYIVMACYWSACAEERSNTMTKEELKQRLIDLVEDLVGICECSFGEKTPTFEQAAKFLIANGVTIRERGEWKDKHCTVCGMTPIDEEPWTSCDITPPKFEWCMDFCPNCGADLRGVKDE